LQGGGAPGISQLQNFWHNFWPFDREYLENTQLYSPSKAAPIRNKQNKEKEAK